jgi:hypothetical protein
VRRGEGSGCGTAGVEAGNEGAGGVEAGNEGAGGCLFIVVNESGLSKLCRLGDSMWCVGVPGVWAFGGVAILCPHRELKSPFAPPFPLTRSYNFQTWLHSPYMIDGTTAVALVHMEYHGWQCPNANCSSSRGGDCANLAIQVASPLRS